MVEKEPAAKDPKGLSPRELARLLTLLLKLLIEIFK